MARRKKPDDSLLTDAELKIMNVVWRRKRASVHEVIEDLPAGTDYSYTTVSTLLRVLEQKCVVTPVKAGRTHLYEPLIAKENYEGVGLRHVIQSVFGGQPKALVRRLLDENSLSDSDLAELRTLIETRSRSL